MISGSPFLLFHRLLDLTFQRKRWHLITLQYPDCNQESLDDSVKRKINLKLAQAIWFLPSVLVKKRSWRSLKLLKGFVLSYIIEVVDSVHLWPHLNTHETMLYPFTATADDLSPSQNRSILAPPYSTLQIPRIISRSEIDWFIKQARFHRFA